jgi:ABC-type Fe3+/spermidine/putrescine transport system ATPase subunit
MNVTENVRFGLKMDRVPREESNGRVQEALHLVGLEDFGDRMPAQLSGGQQQRVAVARALVKRPAVLLLDEPLGALDLKLRQRLQIELTQIHRDVGTTFVYVTHDQEEAMSMADRIAVMNDGRIEHLGTPEEVYRRPASRFVADFIGDSNFFDATVTGDVAQLTDGSRVGCGGGRRDGRATLMVRPEAITLGGASGAIVGRVLQTSFLGSFVRVAVETPSSDAPVVVALREADAVPAIGDEVSLSWPAADGIVLEPDE